jgi:choline monooxygenase
MNDYYTELHPRYSVQKCAGQEGEKRLGGAARYYYVYPNLMLNRYGRWLDSNRVIPVSIDRCKVIFDYFLEPDEQGNVPSISDPLIVKELEASHRIQKEDEWLCKRVQTGIVSDSFDVGRYAPTVEQVRNSVTERKQLVLGDCLTDIIILLRCAPQGMWHFHTLLRQDLEQA